MQPFTGNSNARGLLKDIGVDEETVLKSILSQTLVSGTAEDKVHLPTITVRMKQQVE